MEKWKEIYSRDVLDSIQLIEKNILKEFIRICNILNLEYIIYGGTLLGQVKYGDIVPWDDDIDVAMPRKDYNEFLKKASEFLSNDYVIQSPYNEVRSPFSYTKIRRKETIFIEKYNNLLDIEKGIYIDLYPIDNIPDDETLRKKQWSISQKYCKLYYLRQCIHSDLKKDGINKYLLHFLLYCILHIFPQKYFVFKIDKNMTKYNGCDTKRKACLFSPNYDNIYIRFYPLLKRKLGDIDVMIPFSFDDHLSKRYGNYIEDPPMEKRIGHFPYTVDIPDKILKEEKLK